MEKIIFTVTNDLCFDQRMIRICTSLSKAGYRVLLLGRKKPDSPALSNYSFQQRRLNCFFNRGKLFYIEYNFRLFFFLLFHPFDALCSIDLDTILPGLWASKIKGKVSLFHAHELCDSKVRTRLYRRGRTG